MARLLQSWLKFTKLMSVLGSCIAPLPDAISCALLIRQFHKGAPGALLCLVCSFQLPWLLAAKVIPILSSKTNGSCRGSRREQIHCVVVMLAYQIWMSWRGFSSNKCPSAPGPDTFSKLPPRFPQQSRYQTSCSSKDFLGFQFPFVETEERRLPRRTQQNQLLCRQAILQEGI